MKKFSDAAEQNKQPILNILKQTFSNTSQVLEIGSGSGQHAVYFAAHLPHLTWQPSDLQDNLSSIQAWMAEEHLENIQDPLELDVKSHPWPITDIDAIFTANTFHIMPWTEIQHFFLGVGEHLGDQGRLVVYGPFSFGGHHVSTSNERFDLYLKQRDPLSGVRDFDDVDKLASTQNLRFIKHFPMPVNNSCLYWQKV